MRVASLMQVVIMAAVVDGAVWCIAQEAAVAADAQSYAPATGAAGNAPSSADARNGQAGFVISHFSYALARDAKDTGACPDGMTKGYGNMAEVFPSNTEYARHDGETEQAHLQRILTSATKDPNTPNLCLNPELGKPDPNWRSVKGANLEVEGIDLDGQDSRAGGKAAAGTCAHEDFRGTGGQHGVDNQFYRLVGCSNSFQSTGQSNTFEIEMYTGSWGILLTLKGMTDPRNAKDVEVGIYANADPIELSPTREALPNATYAADQDPHYRATTHGRITDGVLTTDPVDIRLHWIVNSIRLDRTLRDARVRAVLTPDGGIEGILGGYTPINDLYDFQYGFRNGKDGNGNASPLQLRNISSIGQAFVLGHTCNGAYYEMQRLADGHRDPKTGQCTAISTQYKFKAIPAFVVDNATKSSNANLDQHASSQY